MDKLKFIIKKSDEVIINVDSDEDNSNWMSSRGKKKNANNKI